MSRLYSIERNGLAERDFSMEAPWDRLEMLKKFRREEGCGKPERCSVKKRVCGGMVVKRHDAG
jgi:hypothetical protein